MTANGPEPLPDPPPPRKNHRLGTIRWDRFACSDTRCGETLGPMPSPPYIVPYQSADRTLRPSEDSTDPERSRSWISEKRYARPCDLGTAICQTSSRTAS
jgi:hypothetical protein